MSKVRTYTSRFRGEGGNYRHTHTHTHPETIMKVEHGAWKTTLQTGGCPLPCLLEGFEGMVAMAMAWQSQALRHSGLHPPFLDETSFALCPIKQTACKWIFIQFIRSVSPTNGHVDDLLGFFTGHIGLAGHSAKKKSPSASWATAGGDGDGRDDLAVPLCTSPGSPRMCCRPPRDVRSAEREREQNRRSARSTMLGAMNRKARSAVR